MALRAVAPSETPPGPRSAVRMTVSQAAESGTERELLVAMRRRIATAVDDPDTAARDLASLTKRLNEVVREIKAIDARGEDEGAEGGPAADEAWSPV